MLNKRHKKARRFLVHVTAKTEAEIYLLQNALNVQEKIQLQEEHGMHFHTFAVCVSPSTFRRVLDRLPQTIYVSYEEMSAASHQIKTRKPESC